MTYAKKLLDPRWQKKRLEILNRDNWTCQRCHDSYSTLHVHHIAYSKSGDPWDVEDWWLNTLCDKCHLLEEYLKNTEYHILDTCKKDFEDFTTLSCIMTIKNELWWDVYKIVGNEIAENVTFPYSTFQSMCMMESNRKYGLREYKNAVNV